MKHREDAASQEALLGVVVLETLDHLRDEIVRLREDSTPGRALRDDARSLEGARIRELQARLAELERAALTDKLTGAWNRRYIDEAIDTEIARSRRHGQPLSAALLDIDHFKRINDVHGHAAGDRALVELVARLRASQRTTDTVARWGGEEFLVLMPGTDHGDAVRAAERLRATVHAGHFSVGSLTVSAGVAELATAEDAAAYFARLDRLLYEAKRGGRNRVAVDPCAATDSFHRARNGFLHLTWREAYESGNATIDGEHRELFELANHLVSATLAGGVDSPATGAALDTLLGAVTRHFAHEEEILASSGYRGLEQHRKAHAALLDRATALREQAARGEARLGELVEFLARDLVARHMLHADREFFPFVR